MRPVSIDPARGADTTVDSRVAPDGAIARVENMRVDKLGRLVLRNGYQSLGVAVRDAGSSSLVPCDLHNVDGSLVALGNHDPSQFGVRGVYRYNADNVRPWKAECYRSPPLVADYATITTATRVRQLASDNRAEVTDILTADAAVTDNGLYAASVSSNGTTTGFLNIVHLPTGNVIWQQADVAGARIKILALGNVFYVFRWILSSTSLLVATIDPASTSFGSGVIGGVTLSAAVTTADFDVAVNEGALEYLCVFPTATGYTWTRRDSGNTQLATASVVSLAGAAVSICGGSADSINVLNLRTTSGVELCTFSQAGALTAGPTNIDSFNVVNYWVGIGRVSSTVVACSFTTSTVPGNRTRFQTHNTTTHAQVQSSTRSGAFPVSKPRAHRGVIVQWLIPSVDVSRSFVLFDWGFNVLSTATDTQPLAVVQQGGARLTSPAATEAFCCKVAVNGARLFTAFVTRDPRDKTFRAILCSVDNCSTERRQGVTVGGTLYLAGGLPTQSDGRFSSECGFMNAPGLTLGQSVGGSKTLLGVYTVHAIVRSVAANGEVSQSAPSAPVSITLTGGNNRITMGLTEVPTRKQRGSPEALGAVLFWDIYCTEAGGSIPRLTQSIEISTLAFVGAPVSRNEDTADSVTQTGPAMYTQGADGSVSGRLPLAMGAPCELIAESDGKVLLGRLQNPNDLQLSIEKRPGEAVGFVNDDLFYVSNPDEMTAFVAGEDGRRYIFSDHNIRELLGPGPNAAGVGEISEPVEIESRVGAYDWRSVCKTEHGIFFQSSRTDPRIYLLPRGGSSALDVSEGIREVLRAFPVVTSATRHDDEQLLTFTLQSTDGSDGRILHMDLMTSGLGPSGFRATWIIDRVATFEQQNAPYIVSEQVDIIPNALPGQNIQIPAMHGARVGDRNVAFGAADTNLGLGVAALLAASLNYSLRGTASS
ncbi:MAG: hypothetical protein ABW217_22425, partial [Polyangiaceae bacterium]